MNTLELQSNAAQVLNMTEMTVEENLQTDALLTELMQQYTAPSDPVFLQNARVYACQLPKKILKKLNEFKHTENHRGLFLISGLNIDQKQLGPTPEKVGCELDELSGLRESFMLVLLASFLGDPMGWSSQRDGALVNNILPLKSHKDEQLSTGSAVELDWHTEEAFHPCRADYLALMCMRNYDKIATMVASIADVTLPDDIKKVLFAERFIFLTDKNFEGGPFDVSRPQAVLFGDATSPYMKIDPSFMHAIEGDTEAENALKFISNAIGNAMYDLVLEPGQVIFIDNYRVVHGRKPFIPKFDGNDRWLKRINITLDLRKSRTIRNAYDSRVLMTS
jgi:Taurine catabolism dioxygenase TauD, TfdA family